MERGKRVNLPKRPVRKATLTLPEDTIEFLDVCADAVGLNRSGFLSLVLDGFYDEIMSFAKGYATRIIEQAVLTEQRKEQL